MSELLERVALAATEMGGLILRREGLKIGNKTTKEDYVTSTDKEIERRLRDLLPAMLPGSAFLGEEGDDLAGSPDLYWVVDPIDGTANYARGIPASVVSIALVRDGEVVLGVVRNPYTDETFSAERGRGAFLNGTPLHVSARTREHCMVSTAWACYRKDLAHFCFDITERLYYDCEDIRRIGTAAYELCLLAKGASDIYYEIRLAPWDYAAASLIVEEAGGICRSMDGPVDLRQPCSVLGANTEDNFAYLRETVGNVVGKFRVRPDSANYDAPDWGHMPKKLEEYITNIPDFPKPGILFRDVTTIVSDPEGFRLAVDGLSSMVDPSECDLVIGTESRGFVFGAPVAYKLGKGFILARKKGKLPRETVSAEYALEYGTAVLEIHKDAIKPGQRVFVVDDLIATGGTAKAVTELVEKLGGKVVKIGFVLELAGFDARNTVLKGYDVESLVSYPDK